jgi:predicted SAM-dependent methyltransferase
MEDLIRLNLGCGRRVLDGWINVDKAVRGAKPDVDSDVSKLPFEDDYADEVMAIHLIEHFYVWETPEVLGEWKRVLKPGGRMVLECPDLTKTMAFIAEGRTEPHLTMWPLYGDPSHKDPLMCHKWAYTDKSLAGLMMYAGLVDIERHPAKFHMKDIRDMRLVGYKNGN